MRKALIHMISMSFIITITLMCFNYFIKLPAFIFLFGWLSYPFIKYLQDED